MYEVVIIGGGLAGLINALLLSKAGLKVLVVEKNHYPFHRVCGEYISNEVKPFLLTLGVPLDTLQPASINTLMVTSPYGTALKAKLDMGAFGLSRFTLDYQLYQIALSQGCDFKLGTSATEVTFNDGSFQTTLSSGECYASTFVIGSYGKRAALDRTLARSFFYKRSPYIGVKYHIKTDFDKHTIALHNFKDGYCGISAIEDDKYCLCYLSSTTNLKKYGTIEAMEKQVLQKNPYLNTIFNNSEFLFQKPEVVNEVSFAKKTTHEGNLFMSGDTAGMIAPLCGNGMSMAIHSAKLLSETILEHRTSSTPFERIQKAYELKWNAQFSTRLFVGRQIQNLFGNEWITEAVIRTVSVFPPLTHWLIKKTHGKELKA